MNTGNRLHWWQVARRRWTAAMPTFFKRVMWVCALISGTAIAVHEVFTRFGIQPHGWWLDIEPYIIGIPVGAMFVCKFTQRYDKKGEPINK